MVFPKLHSSQEWSSEMVSFTTNNGPGTQDVRGASILLEEEMRPRRRAGEVHGSDLALISKRH